MNASIAPLAFITFGSQVSLKCNRGLSCQRLTIGEQSDCLSVWRDAFDSAFSKTRYLLKRTFGLQSRASTPARDDLPVDRNPAGAEVPKELEKGKDINLSLSIDSNATTESDDSQTPHLPVLLMDQPSRATARRCSDDLDFLTALRTS